MIETVFSKIIAREIPADIVYESDELLAFHDINPQAPIHILVITKQPIPTLNELQDQQAELAGQMLLAARKIASDLGFAESGYRVLINCNQDGGQDVWHLHLHVLAGRRMGWPPG
jgi:histidine triad (HIT) family protein